MTVPLQVGDSPAGPSGDSSGIRRLQRVEVSDLRIGMYVAELDRPWLGSGFLFQGFHIEGEHDLEQLRRSCRWVRVPADDPLLRDDTAETRLVQLGQASPETADAREGQEDVDRAARARRRAGWFGRGASLEDEIERARIIHARLLEQTREVHAALRAGRIPRTRALEQTVTDMVASVTRHPDAMRWLSQLEAVGGYTYEHAVSCAVLAAGLGRHLGLSQVTSVRLATGVALMDVGKACLPDALLQRDRPFDASRRALFRQHVEAGLKLLAGSPGIQIQELTVVSDHHERHDGSGYPEGRRGSQITPFARIAGLVDSYDAMIRPREYRETRSPHAALVELESQRGRLFESALVEQFIQSLGIYPTGSLVRLDSGETAIVIEQNRGRALLPKVMPVLGADGGRLVTRRIIDLLAEAADGDPAAPRIVQPVDAADVGLDPAEWYL